MDAVYLGLIAALTSILTACAGLGGGILLLALMLQILPPIAVIPLHGITQLFSNASRGWIFRDFLRPEYLKPFITGSIIGAFAFVPLIALVDQVTGSLLLGIFILLATWWPNLLPLRRLKPLLSGLLTSGLGLIFGAIGAMTMSAHPKEFWSKEEITGNHAACMAFQHGIKVIVYAIIGFNISAYIWEITALIIGAAFGTWIGTKVLRKISEKRFKKLLKIVLTTLSIRMIYLSLYTLLS